MVIFDCDGVLVDSEPISTAVLCEIIADAGVTIDEELAYDRFLGRSMATVMEMLQADYGLAITPCHLDQLRTRLYDAFRRELKPIDGVLAAISQLPMKYCVASSSQPERIKLALEVTGLLESFEPNIYSSSMVENGKPAPDLFFHAARTMGVQPSACVVIEDSPAGIEAAKRAGMRVFAFMGGSHALPGKLRAAAESLTPDLIFDDMHQLPELLAGTERDGTLP